MLLRDLAPYWIYRRLWGDRRRFGLQPRPNDAEWQIWQRKAYTDFYQHTQQKGAGDKICRMAYPVVRKITFANKEILEVGPGIIRHLGYMKGVPLIYKISDVNAAILRAAERQLAASGIAFESVLLDPQTLPKLPFDDESFDVLISFNSLEHLYQLDKYLDEFARILRPGGHLVGGIPCEGGLAWGLGRLLTTRRYVHKNYSINYDKIICWEHPNFADFIIQQLDKRFDKRYLRLRPLPWLPLDANLVAMYVYARRPKRLLLNSEQLLSLAPGD